MASKLRKRKITGSTTVTAGCTADGRYSLAINQVDGRYCLCVHRCEAAGGLHLSTMDDKSLVTCIDVDRLRFAIPEIERLERVEAKIREERAEKTKKGGR